MIVFEVVVFWVMVLVLVRFFFLRLVFSKNLDIVSFGERLR